jgi:hypothetical protein
MKMKLSRECRRTRTALQSLHDAGGDPRGPLADHMAGCASCSAFRDMLRELPGEIGTRQAAIMSLPAPDLSVMLTTAAAAGKRRAFSISDRFRRLFDGFSPLRQRLLIASAAAVPVLCAIVVVGISLRVSLPATPDADERLEAEAFVAELYSTSFLEDAEYGPADAGLEDWLYEMTGAGSGAGSGFFETP